MVDSSLELELGPGLKTVSISKSWFWPWPKCSCRTETKAWHTICTWSNGAKRQLSHFRDKVKHKFEDHRKLKPQLMQSQSLLSSLLAHIWQLTSDNWQGGSDQAHAWQDCLMKNPKQPNASRCQSKQSKGSKKQASNMSGLPRNGRIWKETAARDGDLCHKRLEEYLQNNSVNCTIIMEIHSQLHDVAFQVQVGQMRHEKWVSVASCWHDSGSRIWAHNSCECRTSGHSLKHVQSQCAKPECQGAIPIKQQARQKNGNIAKKCQTVRVEKPHPASGILQLGPRQASLQWLLLDVSCKTGWKLFATCIQQRKFQKIDLSLEAILTDISQVDNHWMPCTERSHRKRLFQQRHKEKKTWPIQFAVMHRKSFKCWTKQILQLQLVRPRFPFDASTICVKTHRHKLKRIVPSDNWWEPTDS